MARERMVTRTVEFTIANVLTVDTVNRTMDEKCIRVLGLFDDDKSLLMHITKRHDTKTVKTVAVISRESESYLLGMDERKFIANAREMDSRFENGRTRMVTRTVNITTGKALIVDINSRTVGEGSYTVNGVYDDDDSLLKVLRTSSITDANHMIISVLTAERQAILYGMPEQLFCSLADILPPRKVYGDSVEGGDYE